MATTNIAERVGRAKAWLDAQPAIAGRTLHASHPEVIVTELLTALEAIAAERDEARRQRDDIAAKYESEDIRVDAELTAYQAEVTRLKAALKPFSDKVYNDNGDMTIETSPPKSDCYVAAYFAMRAVTAALRTLEGKRT